MLFPGMVITLALESDEARQAVSAATEGSSQDGLIILVPQVDGRIARVGTVARVEEIGKLSNGGSAIVARGLHRAVVGAGVTGITAALWVQVEPVEEDDDPTERAFELAGELYAVIDAILDHRGAQRFAPMIPNADEPAALADSIGYWPEAPQELKVEALETVDLEQRLSLVLGFARKVLAELEVRDRIRNDVADGMEKTQREFLLRQQLAAIRKELGEDNDEDVISEFRAAIEREGVPEAVKAAVEKELAKLERTSEQSAEYGWVRNWLETITEMPWGKVTEDNLDLTRAKDILDADHTGLDDVKERILEFLAVRKLRLQRNIEVGNGRGSGAILTLVGPPGVGKTSLGESIARTMGRKFVRVALGGVHDEAEIRGHRRTYVGAAPGRIVRAFQEAGTMNPVFLLDEVDKVGHDWRGDVSSALLEVLDPAQNHSFKDHYLEVDLDLSDVVFLTTANVLDTIPQPLLDRMEIIQLDGYIEAEKVAIGRDHLVARQRRHAGLNDGEVTLTDDALRAIAGGYTREPGVRSLERQIGKVLRKAATKIASGEITAPVSIDEDDIAAYLGRARFTFEAAERTSVPGVASGLAVTGMGGDVLFIEATTLPDTSENGRAPALRLTGQLGDVMKESAEIALSYVRSHADELGISINALHKGDLHLHVPAGATPKDGPSAGVTMTTALVSLLTNVPVRSTVAMTGEVTLRGKVLPIGGVKQKLLAAHRAGMTDVIIPARNEPDLDDVPEQIRQALDIHLAEDVSDVLKVALAA